MQRGREKYVGRSKKSRQMGVGKLVFILIRLL